MDAVDVAILDTLYGVQRKFKKTYSKPGQKRILELVKEFHSVQICRRTLNYRLRYLEDAKIIKRFRQHYRDDDGVLHLRTTAYYLKKRGSAVLRRVLRAAERLAEAFPVQRVAHNIVNKDQDIGQEGEPEPTGEGRAAWLGTKDALFEQNKRRLLRKE